MALFKILRGSEKNLPDKITDGYCYFTTDTGLFYIDYKDNNEDLQRVKLNADTANKLNHVIYLYPDKSLYDVDSGKSFSDGSDWFTSNSGEILNYNYFYNSRSMMSDEGESNEIIIPLIASLMNITPTGRYYEFKGYGYNLSIMANVLPIKYGGYVYNITTIPVSLIKQGDGNYSEIFNDWANNIANGDYSHAEGLQTKINPLIVNESNIDIFNFLPHVDFEFDEEIKYGKNMVVIYQNELYIATKELSSTKDPSAWRLADKDIDGNWIISIPESAHAEGKNTTAKNLAAHSEGLETQALGSASHAEGNKTIAYGHDSHAEGFSTTVGGTYSHGEGYKTITTGVAAHSEGSRTLAAGRRSHAENSCVVAYGESSHAEGHGGNEFFQVLITPYYNGYYNLNQSLSDEYVGAILVCNNKAAQIKSVSGNQINLSEDLYIASNEWHTAYIYKFGAFEKYSHAEGYQPQAKGVASHSEGTQTQAIGHASHTEGHETIASATYAHAENHKTVAKGEASHAEGSRTIAAGRRSHSENESTIAKGESSHAEGGYTLAIGDYSHAQGYSSIAYGSKSTAEGFFNFSVGEGSHAEGLGNGWLDNIILTGDANSKIYTYSAPENSEIETQNLNYEPYIGAMILYNNKLFKIINVQSEVNKIVFNETLSENKALEKEIVFIYKYGAYGAYSHTKGVQTLTLGDFSYAEGARTIAYDQCSHAEGTGSWDNPIKITIIKNNNNQYIINEINEADIDIGYLIQYKDQYASVLHKDNLIIELNKDFNIIDEDNENEIEVMVYSYGAIGYSSHSEGSCTLAGGMYDHAEGECTKAIGGKSHAEGYNTIAKGQYSHAEGDSTIALGQASHSNGRNTIAAGDSQTVIGKYNEIDENNKYAFIIGNGKQNINKDEQTGEDIKTEVRNNALTVDWNGNIRSSGKVIIDNGNELIDHETTIRNINLAYNAPRMVKRNDDLYLFMNSCFVISKDRGATFGNYTDLCNNEKVDSGELIGNDVTVRTITPIVLKEDKDNRIAVFYSVEKRTEDVGYSAIRVRYIDENNNVSEDYETVIEYNNIGPYEKNGENASAPMGGLWEPFPYYIGNDLYIYYCDSAIYSDAAKQSVNYIKFKDVINNNVQPKTAIKEISEVSGKSRRPGMPSVTKLNDKYYMVVECNDQAYIQADDYANKNEQNLTVAIALFSSEDGENWEFNKLLGTNHPMQKCGAPYITALPDGKIAFCFQCKEREENAIKGTVGYSSSNPHDRRVYTYISKENIGEPKDRTYEPINVYNYAPNEAGYWSGLFELDGVLYTMFTHCLNNTYSAGSESYTALGNVIIANKALLNEILYVHNGEGTYSTEENMFVQATGKYSHAEGVNSVASGLCAHSEGYGAQATKDAAHAEGKFTIASGLESHAEGYGSVAGKTGDVTPSTNTTAKDGRFAHAEGHATKASGHAAHSEGLKTDAQGNYSHTEGESTLAIGTASHAEGIFEGVSTDKSYQHITLDNYGSRGNYSHTEGGSTGATGAYSHAEGQYSLAARTQAHAEGFGTQAHGQGSHSEGVRTVAGVSGQSAAGQHAEGADTAAIGNRAHAEGNKTRAQGNYSHAEGNSSNKAPSNVNINTIISESNKKPFSIAYGTASHVEGVDNLAIGDNSHAEGYDNIAYGEATHVEGKSNSAFGASSHAEGLTTIASESSSHSEGSYTLAAGYTAHAEGYGDNAPISIKITSDDFNSYISSTPLLNSYINKILSYNNNFAKIVDIDIESQKIFIDQFFDDYVENVSATIYSSGAIGNYSHSEGFQNRAIGSGSHSEGYQTISLGDYSHTEGYDTQSIGNYSHAEGENNATGVYIEITQDELNEVPTITFDPGIELDTSYSKGTVAKYMYDAMLNDNLNYYIAINEPSYAYNIDDWEELKWESGKLITAAKAAHVEGSYNNAGGLTSHAEGWSTQSLGNYSHSEGYDTEAKATASHSEGYSTTANGKYSHVEGRGNITGSEAAHAEGKFTRANGAYSHSEGYQTRTLGNSSHIEGHSNYISSSKYTNNTSNDTIFEDWNDKPFSLAKGRGSHSEGCNTLALDEAAHTEGYKTQATNISAHAEGYMTTASGERSHSEGSSTLASGYASHAGGRASEANGNTAFAHGEHVKAEKENSSAFGRYTTANARNQFVVGRFNAIDTPKDSEGNGSYAFIVGNGTSESDRKNALVVEWNGKVRGQQIFGAVWNDYAEYRDQIETIEPGYCVVSADNGQVSKTTEKFQVCDGIVSDTFGFAIGETDNCRTPLAVAGRVLAYCEGDRLDYHAGDTVCAGPNGKVTKMTREEIREWPDRIVGTVSEIPMYETWGTDNVTVNGRIWIKIK